MEILIFVAVIIILIFVLKGNGNGPNIENFTPDQMNRYVTSLQNWIDLHASLSNPSDSIRMELKRKRAQYDLAMSVWRRKIDEANGQSEQLTMEKRSINAIENELTPIIEKVQKHVIEGKNEPEASAAALKEWHESEKPR